MVVIRSSIRPLLRQVAAIISKVLQDKGYHREEVCLLGSWNEQSDRLYLALLTSRPLDLKVLQPLYADVMNGLRERLDEPGKPPVTWHISLIMGYTADGRSPESTQFTVTEEEEDVSDFLESMIDHAWAERKPSRTATAAPE